MLIRLKLNEIYEDKKCLIRVLRSGCVPIEEEILPGKANLIVVNCIH